MKECETMKNWIVIPALEPGDGLCAYIRELQQRICASVLVVDDGSGDASRHIFDRIGEMKGCAVLRHGHNRGKGRALKTAFAYVEEHAGQESRIVCVDCDGQHAPEDVEYLLGLAAVEPGTLILGARDFSEEGVPFRSLFGNRAVSFLFWLVCGKWFRDTQTGLRAFDGSLLELMREIPGERFEYETQMLVSCAKNGVPIIDRPIRTIYEDGNAGSHFRPFRDSVSVLQALFSELIRFASSSLVCAALDVLLFWSVLEALTAGAGDGGFRKIAAATGTARIVSAGLNYVLNRSYVFHSDRKALSRYLVLCAALAAASAVFVFALSRFVPVTPVWKVFCDTVLFFVSYRIQKIWVFAGEKSDRCADRGRGKPDGAR